MTHSLLATQVEAEALGLVDYHNIVTEPMDLGTVDDRVQRGYYDRTPMDDEDVDEELLSPLELDELRAKRIRTGAAADIRLTFENAIKFNSADSASPLNFKVTWSRRWRLDDPTTQVTRATPATRRHVDCWPSSRPGRSRGTTPNYPPKTRRPLKLKLKSIAIRTIRMMMIEG